MSYLRTENLKKDFVKGQALIGVLKGINFTLEKGGFVSVVGASGAGKSTFLHILGGLDHPTFGEVLLEEASLYKMQEEKVAEFRNKTVGLVFQFHHLLPEFTALENVSLPMMIARSSKEDALDKAKRILGEVGLSHRIHHKPGEMSGGEQQRVAIARALINDPQILLADEPTGNLDSKTGEDIFELILAEKQKRGMSLVVVTHNEELANRADQKVKLKDGVLFYE